MFECTADLAVVEYELLWVCLQKESLEKIAGFRTPTADAFNPDNVGSFPSVPTRFDVPSVPAQPTTPRGFGGGGNARTLPSRGKLSTSNVATSVLQTSLPPVPGGGGGDYQPKATAVSPRASIISTDSGIGTSVGAEVCRTPRHRGGSKSTPNSGSATFNRGAVGSGDDAGDSGSSGSGSLSHSADSEFRHRIKVCYHGEH